VQFLAAETFMLLSTCNQGPRG